MRAYSPPPPPPPPNCMKKQRYTKLRFNQFNFQFNTSYDILVNVQSISPLVFFCIFFLICEK